MAIYVITKDLEGLKNLAENYPTNNDDQIFDLVKIAIIHDNIEALKYFISRDVNFVNKHGRETIYYSYRTQSNKLEITKLLLDSGLDINSELAYGLTLLMESIFINDMDCFNYLVDRGSDINILSSRGQSPLFICLGSNVKMATRLFLKGGKCIHSGNVVDIVAWILKIIRGYLFGYESRIEEYIEFLKLVINTGEKVDKNYMLEWGQTIEEYMKSIGIGYLCSSSKLN